MPDLIDPRRQTRRSRARLLFVATLLTGVLVGGCGGSSASQTATTAAGAVSPSSTVATHSRPHRSHATAPGVGGAALAFAKCMRASGVPNFPDPQPGGGLLFPVTPGVNPASPAVTAAQAKCRKLLPNGGPPGPGSTTHPDPHTLQKLITIARCMRRHGVPQFPDPRTSVPANPTGFQEITDFDGAILLFPATMNIQAPAYKQALSACGAPPLGLPH